MTSDPRRHQRLLLPYTEGKYDLLAAVLGTANPSIYTHRARRNLTQLLHYGKNAVLTSTALTHSISTSSRLYSRR
ncbi:hypothetical protein LshimejAT787_0706360 [Lyophyllum shimeji]|uniref:Uncharacterized protein n=1 Tax=Lyophyllum shimeji TaxID=47721 RepID=A0A9P3PRQ7_LYOSH|nr:hypothetical protein LshimejAT787_0706360 [Lyophyllum shimeji]